MGVLPYILSPSLCLLISVSAAQLQNFLYVNSLSQQFGFANHVTLLAPTFSFDIVNLALWRSFSSRVQQFPCSLSWRLMTDIWEPSGLFSSLPCVHAHLGTWTRMLSHSRFPPKSFLQQSALTYPDGPPLDPTQNLPSCTTSYVVVWTPSPGGRLNKPPQVCHVFQTSRSSFLVQY